MIINILHIYMYVDTYVVCSRRLLTSGAAAAAGTSSRILMSVLNIPANLFTTVTITSYTMGSLQAEWRRAAVYRTNSPPLFCQTIVLVRVPTCTGTLVPAISITGPDCCALPLEHTRYMCSGG